MHTNEGQAGSTRHVALYLRVSTQRQADEGSSLDTQEAALRAREPNGILYPDRGKSARTAKARPEFDNMLAAIERGEVSKVVATKPDRLARSVIDWAQLVALCGHHDTRLETISGGLVDTTAAAVLTSNVLAALGQFESDLRSERVREVIAFQRERGIYARRPPIGYRREGDNIVPSADHWIIREAFLRYDRGATISDVWDWLKEQPTETREQPWTRLSDVSRLLRRKTYAGFVVWNTKTDNQQQVTGKHEALVAPEVWQRTQERLRRNTETGYRGFRINPLGPIARCAGCGRSLRHKADGEGRSYIVCNAFCGADAPKLPLAQLEFWTANHLGLIQLWIIGALDSGEWRLVIDGQKRAQKLSRNLARITSAREELLGHITAGVVTRQDARNHLKMLSEEEATTRPQWEAAMRSEGTVESELRALSESLNFGWSDTSPDANATTAMEWWKYTPLDSRIKALEAFIERVEISDTSISWKFKYGFPVPISLPIVKLRQTTALTAEFAGWGFGVNPVVGSLSPARARSGDRTPSPPCAAPPARG
jgi:DNA invertase Pin-like site-specific DNA recombinase